MADRLAVSFKQLAPRIVSKYGEYRPARVQRFEIRGNIPTRDILEHGDALAAGIVTDIPEYTATISAMDVSIKLFSALTGTYATAYPAVGVSINSLTTIDLIGDVKSETVADYVKTVYLRKARVQSMRLAYSVDGDSTEEYVLGTSTRQWFSHDVIVEEFDASVASPATLTNTPEVLKNGNYAISVLLDGVHLTEVSAAPGDGEYSISGTSLSYNATSGTLIVTYKASATVAWTDIRDTTIPVAISGKNVPVTISTNSIPRVQSVNINVDLKADTIKEQGNVEVVGYTYQIPDVTGDLAVLDTDLELMAMFSTGNIDSTDTEFRACELTANYGLDLQIELRDPSDPCTTSGSVLKTIYVPNIQITGESYTSNVGNNVTHTFNFKSANANVIVYSGAMA